MTTQTLTPQTLTVDRAAAKGVALVTLSRPDTLNAYTPTMCAELTAVVRELDADDAVRVVALTGAGRGFCSGADLKSDEFALDGVLGRAKELRADSHTLNLTLHRMAKPLIGLINGPAVAGGLALALLCDIRIASRTAKLGDTSGRFGLLPDEGLAWLLPRTVGLERATEMILRSTLLDGAEAAASGLVGEVVEPEDLLTRGLAVAAEIAARPAASTQSAKWLVRQSVESSFAQSLDAAAFAVLSVNLAEGTQERIRSFRGPTS